MISESNRVDASLLSAFLCGGSEYLEKHKAEVDALNVFPVPDGDTGTNMSLTVGSAAKNISAASMAEGIGAVSADFALGALMGARGNSGVILSQIFRGLALAMANKKDCSVTELAEAMQKGVDLSYKSVMKPVEGTILTVFRELVTAAKAKASKSNLAEMMETAIEAGKKALENTPNQLPVLKEAGVVDAGGAGLLTFIQGGMEAVSNGTAKTFELPASQPKQEIKFTGAASDDISTADIKYSYCTQLLIKGHDLPIDEIREHLSQTPPGDSLLVVGNDTVIKIHYHNNHPGQVLEYCANFGTLHDIIIDNMVDQHHENRAAMELEMQEAGTAQAQADAIAAADAQAEAVPAENAPACGVIAICCGEGMHETFNELGAAVISGGQTMNPSAEDILTAVRSNPAKEVVILPNNGNIILTANQVKELSEKPVEVVNTKFVTQGLAAMLEFSPENSAEENAAAMSDAIENIINGELTYSIRPAKFNGFDIKEGDVLALMDGDIVDAGKDLGEMLDDLVGKMMAANEDSEMLSLYWGNDLGEEKAAEMAAALEEKYPDHDVEVYYGGQPLYYFLLSLE